MSGTPGKHDEITERIIGTFYDVHNELGHGFLEVVYREAMKIALQQAGFLVECEFPVPVYFRGDLVGTFRADIIVNGSVLVELKACEQLLQTHASQTLHYLRATKIEVALLMNFGPKASFRRLVMNNESKNIPRGNEISAVGVKAGDGIR